MACRSGDRRVPSDVGDLGETCLARNAARELDDGGVYKGDVLISWMLRRRVAPGDVATRRDYRINALAVIYR